MNHPANSIRFIFAATRLPAIVAALWCATAVGSPAIAPTTGDAMMPKQHVIIISGINRDPEQVRDKAQAVHRLHQLFSGITPVPATLRVLVAPGSPVADIGIESTRENLLSALKSVHESIHPADRLLLYYVGQANIVNEALRLNLPGPDLTHVELAAALAPFSTSASIIVLDCPGAGLAIEALSLPNRVIIAATRSDQPHSPHFSRYFVPALDQAQSDFDADGRTSLLEAFQWTAQQIDARYRDQGLLKNETPLLEDDSDGEPSQAPWRHETTGKDGKQAARCFLSTAPTVHTEPSSNPKGGNHDQAD